MESLFNCLYGDSEILYDSSTDHSDTENPPPKESIGSNSIPEASKEPLDPLIDSADTLSKSNKMQPISAKVATLQVNSINYLLSDRFVRGRFRINNTLPIAQSQSASSSLLPSSNDEDEGFVEPAKDSVQIDADSTASFKKGRSTLSKVVHANRKRSFSCFRNAPKPGKHKFRDKLPRILKKRRKFVRASETKKSVIVAIKSEFPTSKNEALLNEDNVVTGSDKQLHKNKKQLFCNLCDEQFNSKDAFFLHLKTTHRLVNKNHRVLLDTQRSFSCYNCHFITDDIIKFICHLNIHSISLSCTKCHSKFPTLVEHDRHRLTSRCGRFYKCCICHNPIAYDSLEKHKIKRHGSQHFSKECSMYFTSNNNFAQHCLEMHSLTTENANISSIYLILPKLQCVYCLLFVADATFLSKHVMSSHTTWHCKFCDLNFVDGDLAVRHLYTHTDTLAIVDASIKGSLADRTSNKVPYKTLQEALNSESVSRNVKKSSDSKNSMHSPKTVELDESSNAILRSSDLQKSGHDMENILPNEISQDNPTSTCKVRNSQHTTYSNDEIVSTAVKHTSLHSAKSNLISHYTDSVIEGQDNESNPSHVGSTTLVSSTNCTQSYLKSNYNCAIDLTIEKAVDQFYKEKSLNDVKYQTLSNVSSECQTDAISSCTKDFAIDRDISNEICIPLISSSNNSVTSPGVETPQSEQIEAHEKNIEMPDSSSNDSTLHNMSNPSSVVEDIPDAKFIETNEVHSNAVNYERFNSDFSTNNINTVSSANSSNAEIDSISYDNINSVIDVVVGNSEKQQANIDSSVDSIYQLIKTPVNSSEVSNLNDCLSVSSTSANSNNKIIHYEKPEVCIECNFKAYDNETFWDHVESHCGIRRCCQCLRHFSNSLKFIEHTSSCISETQCLECSINFSNHDDLRAHILTHADNIDLLQCSNELLIHHKPKKQCVVCDMFVVNPQKLWHHFQKFHSEDSVYTCKICGKTFEKLKHIFHHSYNHRDIYSKVPANSEFKSTFTARMDSFSFNCFQCDTVCDSLVTYATHSFATHGCFFCSMCKGKFNSWDSLIMHEHQPESCSICVAEFKNDNEKRIHYNNMHFKHQCTLCSKYFLRYDVLKTHLKRCNQYKCPLCQKSLSNVKAKIRHISAHEDAKIDVLSCTLTMFRSLYTKYQCVVCGIFLPTSLQLERHIISKHLKSTTCLVCGLISTPDVMLRHSIFHEDFKNPHLTYQKLVVESEDNCISKVCHSSGDSVVHDKGLQNNEYAVLPPLKRKKHVKRCRRSIEKRFLCEHCREYFTSMNSLYLHQRSGTFKCSVCEDAITFCSRLRLLRHLKEKHSRYLCSKCRLTFQSLHDLKQHFLSAHTTHFAHCGFCGKQPFITRNSLRHHYLTHRSSFNSHKISCPDCSFQTTTTRRLAFHVFIQHSKRLTNSFDDSHSCCFCSETFSDNVSMVAHIAKVHYTGKAILSLFKHGYTALQRLRCKHCKIAFSSKTLLREHLSTAHQPPSVDCKICSVRYPSEAVLRNHLVSTHEFTFSGRKWTCSDCKHSSFKMVTIVDHYLRRHSMLVLPKPRCSQHCLQCGKAFASVEALKIHIGRVHQTEMKCTKCNQVSATKKAWSFHKETHFTERNFVCTICRKAFTFQRNLAYHSSIHRPKTYRQKVCCICSVQILPGHHSNHFATIHPLRLRQCQECLNMGVDSEFFEVVDDSAAGIRHHAALAHNNYPFPCLTCPSKFVTEEELMQHRVKFHGEYLQNLSLDCPFSTCNRCYNGSKKLFMLLSHIENEHCLKDISSLANLRKQYPKMIEEVFFRSFSI